MASFMERMGGMLATGEVTIKLDRWERERVERHLREVAAPAWEEANKGDSGGDVPALTLEEVMHGLLLDGLGKAEAEAGLVGLLYGTPSTDGKPWIAKDEYDRLHKREES